MGPLAGVKIVELAGIGPGPMCAMVLADLGASILRIERKQKVELGTARPLKFDFLLRGRHSIAVDLKAPASVDLVLYLLSQADALIEGFRPGVAERLGLGPEACWARNERLVYGRITGWGQEGPLAQSAGHDLNYIAITGALHAIGRRGELPSPPLRLGDYGGGAMYLALGILAAVLAARKSGKGQVVDASIVDGTGSLLTALIGLVAGGLASPERGANEFDSGAFFYDSYECDGGGWISVGITNDQHYAELLRIMGVAAHDIGDRHDRSTWEKGRALFTRIFKTLSRDQWCERFAGSDACVAPVLNLEEAPGNKHLMARNTFVDIGGFIQPAPAPRFSRTKPATPIPPQSPIPMQALKGWKTEAEIERLLQAGIL